MEQAEEEGPTRSRSIARGPSAASRVSTTWIAVSARAHEKGALHETDTAPDVSARLGAPSSHDLLATRSLSTEVTVDTDDFDAYHVPTRQVVTFALKEFKVRSGQTGTQELPPSSCAPGD